MTTPPRKSQPGIPWAALGCAVAGLVLFQFFGNATRGYIHTASMFGWWVGQWLDPAAEMEHGWLVLGIAVWLAWRNLDASARRKVDASDVSDGSGRDPCAADRLWPATMALFAGLALHALGFVAQQTRLSIAAFLLYTWGVLRLAGGRRWGDATLFPLGFMLLAIPLNVLDSAGFWLRLWVIDASSAIAHAAGIGVIRSGTLLIAADGHYNYDVAAACSGVRSLMALVALALLLGYLSFRSWWRRAVALLLCFPFVYLGNVVRIVAIIFAAQWGGQARGDQAHTLMGWVVFVIVLGGVFVGVRLIQRWWPEPAATDPGVAPGGAAISAASGADFASARTPGRPVGRFAGGLAAVVLLVAAAEMTWLHTLARRESAGAAGVRLAAGGVDPVELPSFIGTDWIGRRTEVTQPERDILPADTGFSRKLYLRPEDPAHGMFFSVVLSGRDRTSIHRPELCLVAQGWTVIAQTEHRFELASHESVTASLLHVQRERLGPRGRETESDLIAYWFVGSTPDTLVATHSRRIFLDAWNRVAHGRADRWAYVLMQTDASDGDPAALARMQAVLQDAWPALRQPAG